ncbi:MAG TPA: SGNH/GDSL hydrolase family protein [Myxococcota bacterium]|nr:SGNH/GDSL hydrolase family protein [Myxococcota bacterium]
MSDRRIAGSLALAVAATALALGAAEMALRIAPPDTPELPPRHAPLPPGLPQLTTVFEIASPDVVGVYKGVLHRTNHLGVRGPELPLVPRPGTFRIALIGDSIAMGEGVAEDETYAARAARLLAADDPRHAYEVVNLGISGVTAPQAAGRLESVGALYHPQLVVYGYTLNDIEGPAYRAAPRPERLENKRLLARFKDSRSALLRAVWPRLVVAWSAFFPLRGSYERELADNYRENPAAWHEVEAALDRIAAQSHALGACTLLFVHPRLQDLTWLHAFEPFYRQVADAARARGFHVAVAFDALRGERAASLRFSEVDPHPNPQGHRLLAQALHDAIRALPAECLAPYAATGAPRG